MPEQIPLEEFEENRTAGHRFPTHVVRCGCGYERCQGWAEVEIGVPWGLRPWEMLPEMSGPLDQGEI